MLLFIFNFCILCLALEHLIYFAMGTENSKGKTLKEDNMKEKLKMTLSQGGENPRREKKERDRKRINISILIRAASSSTLSSEFTVSDTL